MDNKAPFGSLADGTPIEIVTLAAGPVTARLITYGATLQSLETPDRAGTPADIVLGYATLEDYVAKPEFFGATVGRYANRIALGRFSLDGRTHTMARTDPPNTLHGGRRGFDKRVWQIAHLTGTSVTFRRTSPDGEEGFPGALTADATYALAPDGTLTLSYEATTDAPTVLNLTNHSYFNLAGEASGVSALDHIVTIEADEVTEVDEGLIPTGAFLRVAGSPFDFRDPTPIAARLRDGRNPQLVLGRGYDHNMILRGGVTEAPRPAVRVHDPRSGRVLDIATTEPGVQFYSGNFLDATKVGKAGRIYRQGDGVAFETQHFPDSPNHPHFPTTRLDPGQTYRSTTVWRFSTVGA
jgi:aldose 1-epimerase